MTKWMNSRTKSKRAQKFIHDNYKWRIVWYEVASVWFSFSSHICDTVKTPNIGHNSFAEFRFVKL